MTARRFFLALVVAIAAAAVPATAAERVVNFYNWSDYIAPTVFDAFTRETGIEVRYDEVTAGYAGNISLWDLVDPKPKFSKKLKTLAYCVTFTPDGKAAISGHLNGFVIVTPLTPAK